MLDHHAIYKAYPDVVVRIDDTLGAFDKDNVRVNLDQSKIDAARVELNKLNYKWQRAAEYPDWGTQLDYIYHNGIEKWKTDMVDPVKAKYPKPE
tara:strand:+ start:561 stop:842 length:282 start_codon:yes stop_codon:yes gene_type:complete